MVRVKSLIDLLDGWSGGSTTRGSTSSSREASRHSLRHSSRHASSTLVQLGDDGVTNLLQLLLLMLILILLSSLRQGQVEELIV